MEGSFVHAGGYGLYCLESGSGDPVVWVHGNTGSCRWFEKVMDIPGFRHLAFDLPNFGRSEALKVEPDIVAYADVVIAFIEELNLAKPILVGHSLGGAVAMAVATRRPELLRALVLVDSSPPSGLVTPKEHYPMLEMMRTNKSLLTQSFRGVAPTLKDEVFFQVLVDDAMLMAEPCWLGNAKALERFECVKACESFAKPVLVVWGRKDAIVKEPMARQTASAFPDSKLEIIDEVGHSVIAEDPARFKNLFTEFVAGIK